MNRPPTVLIALALASLAHNSRSFAATPVTNALTYQGQLKDAGNPVTGVYDFNFALFDADVGGLQIASESVPDHSVTNGIFTVSLDFGDIPWAKGEARWLEIRVRPGASVAPFTLLSPRQPLTGSPFSLATRGIVVDANDRVGIGTTAPMSTLHVTATQASIRAQSTGPSGAIGSTLVLDNDDPAALIATTFDMFGDSTSARISLREDDGSLTFSVPNGSEKMRVTGPGLAIGATSANARLTIQGGASGTGLALNVSDALLVNGNTGFVGVGRDDAVTTSEVFGLYKDSSSFAGMYIETLTDGEPFYGYAAGGDVDAYTYYNSLNGSWRVNIGNADRFTIAANGSVGIATTLPGFPLEVNGNAAKPGGGSWTNSSDIHLKKNIAELDHPLDTLLALHGVTFEYKDPASINELPGRRTGMIAQQVESVIPDWVAVNARGHKTVTYRGFEALTVEALRELQQQKDREIAQLRAEKDAQIADLCTRIESLEHLMKQLAEKTEGTPQ